MHPRLEHMHPEFENMHPNNPTPNNLPQPRRGLRQPLSAERSVNVNVAVKVNNAGAGAAYDA